MNNLPVFQQTLEKPRVQAWQHYIQVFDERTRYVACFFVFRASITGELCRVLLSLPLSFAHALSSPPPCYYALSPRFDTIRCQNSWIESWSAWTLTLVDRFPGDRNAQWPVSTQFFFDRVSGLLDLSRCCFFFCRTPRMVICSRRAVGGDDLGGNDDGSLDPLFRATRPRLLNFYFPSFRSSQDNNLNALQKSPDAQRGRAIGFPRFRFLRFQRRLMESRH